MIKLVHLYPKAMNLYGDQGNLIALLQRLKWLGYDAEIAFVHKGDPLDLTDVDMIFMGGGSDREQGLIVHDLQRFSDPLYHALEDGMPALMICGAYQLMGKTYQTENEEISGLGWFDFHTIGAKQRLVGNIIIECEISGHVERVIGFENHGGRTYFNDHALSPWGKVIKGFGNNHKDLGEGLRWRNLIATYLHGPLLPKNPAVADFFIQTILKRKGIAWPGDILDNGLETYAHQQIYKRMMT